MRRLFEVLFVLAVIVVAVRYGPAYFRSLTEDTDSTSEELTSRAEREPVAAPASSGAREPDRQRERDREEAQRLFDEGKRAAKEAQADAIRKQIDSLRQAERNCYAAARRPGGTEGQCRSYANQISQAEDRLRALDRQ